MKCVKTGIMFSGEGIGEDTFHGDMFFNETLNIFIIRGIAQGTSSCKPDITIKKNDQVWYIYTIDEKFKLNFERMNCGMKLSVGGSTILVDDTRFF